MSFSEYQPTRRARRNYWLVGLIVVALILIGSVVVIRKTYSDNLKPVSTNKTSHVITVKPGSTPSAIGEELLSKGVVRSDWAFEWYVRNHRLGDQLKAGTYVIYESQNVQEIVDTLISGDVATDLVTILPGKRLSQVRDGLIESGFAEADVDAALAPAQYADHPALVDKPAEASLEGYLYPESFQKTAETTATQVITQSLDEMKRRLTAERRQAFTKNGLTVHQAVTLASIIEGEVGPVSDREQVSQVFQKRMKEGMRLESNATDEYKKINPAYDTYNIDGLPPGPISNLSETALDAVAYPAQTDWTYFVSGDDKKTHFSKTFEEHQALIQKYCTKLCS